MNLQFLPLPVLDLRPPVRLFLMSLHVLSRLASQIVHLNLSWASWTRLTRRAVQPLCTSAQGWMCCSIVWRATLLFRELTFGFFDRQTTERSFSYTERTPRPANPILRPAYQGSNPVADIFSMWALRTTVKYLPRIAKDSGDHEARSQMLYVSYPCSASQF
jgi:hypothetical protein